MNKWGLHDGSQDLVGAQYQSTKEGWIYNYGCIVVIPKNLMERVIIHQHQETIVGVMQPIKCKSLLFDHKNRELSKR